jgi:hypothetical protein
MIQFLWALVGALLSLVVYVGYEHLSLLWLRRPKDLFVDWHSSWQPTFDSGWHWVTERLKISRRFGRIVLENRDNSANYQWKGIGKIVDGRFLVGQWKSVKPGSQSAGMFLLAVGVDGNFMFGYFFGPGVPAGAKLNSGFVLGRKPEDVDEARENLRKTQIVFP